MGAETRSSKEEATCFLNLCNKEVRFNQAFCTLLGYTPFEIDHTLATWYSIFHPEDNAALLQYIGSFGNYSSLPDFSRQCRLKTKYGNWKPVSSWFRVAECDKKGLPALLLGKHVPVSSSASTRMLETPSNSSGFEAIIGTSKVMQKVYQLIRSVAVSDTNVVIYGESGTGKELVAQTIHKLSRRHTCGFIPINCAAIPSNLMESEFFGYKKGAFTGASADKAGYLDWAAKGTLFMDEVAELALDMQAKLLRAIDGGGYSPVGGQDLKKSDVRIIAATNCNLTENVRNKTMREDFFYRLHVLPIHLPCLRDRKEDIPLLVGHFLKNYCDSDHIPVLRDTLLEQLIEYDWPGNIRELQNTILRYLTIGEVEFIHMNAPASKVALGQSPRLPHSFESGGDLKSVMIQTEKDYIQHVLETTRWKKGKAAKILGINRKTLYKKLKEYGIGNDLQFSGRNDSQSN